ncbi:T6SS immunity protein Tli4 family protein [Rugamonas rubra]|uniref:Tle cognate immunity protein 4 C-terminal domain-containing protein n=1 Tax=Rugamonas rubra TaxID=758825 RepID=A0A1I4JCD8_9BURK|nr:T6SS immunity protein Tli4 family protein [Rugamonas rubra]SFL64215.1 hypothetical protein SAMN02982985_00924 [Rugamonas rubra]
MRIAIRNGGGETPNHRAVGPWATAVALPISTFALLLVVAADGMSAQPKGNAGAQSRSAKHMLAKMRTMCVGRFLIDVPDKAVTSFRPAFLSGWDISSIADQTDQEFIDWMDQKEAALKIAKGKDGKPNRYTIAPVTIKGFSGKFFISGRYWDTWNEGGKKVTGEVAELLALVRGGGVSFSLFATERGPEETRELEQIINQIKPLADGEIPSEPGFCIERGIIREPLTAKQHERVKMFVGFNDHRDISITFDTEAGLKGDLPLLERSAQNSVRLANPSVFHLLRRRVRNIGAIEGQEYLERVRENDGVECHSFAWEAIHYDKKNVYKPQLELRLGDGFGRPGEQLNASLSDKAVLELWDKMLSSLRVRPTTIPKPVVPEPPPPATQTYAGTACPQTGWWRCFEGGDKVKVFHGHTQYYRK